MSVPLLLPHVLGGQGVHRLHLAGLHRGHGVGRLDGVEDLAGQPGRHRVERPRRAGIGGPVAQRPLPLAFLQEGEGRREGVRVERGLDLEDLHPGVGDEAAQAPVGRVQLGGRRVHEGLGVLHGLRVVVVAQALVTGQAGGHALVPAVHGHQVDIDVDQQVRGGRPLVDLDVLALFGLAQMDEVVRVLGVVLGQPAGWGEGVVDPVAQGVPQLGLGHAAVQGQGGDEDHVVHPGVGRHVEDGLDHHLADVGRLHGRQRQRDVVEADGELHAGVQQLGQRVAVAHRVQQGVADGAVGVIEGRQGLGGVDDPAALGQRLEGEALAVPEQRRRGGLVHFQDETGTAAHRVCPFLMSKAILTAPRRPAAPAWATASSKRVSG